MKKLFLAIGLIFLVSSLVFAGSASMRHDGDKLIFSDGSGKDVTFTPGTTAKGVPIWTVTDDKGKVIDIKKRIVPEAKPVKDKLEVLKDSLTAQKNLIDNQIANLDDQIKKAEDSK